MRGISVFRVFGISIELHPTWILIFLLVAWSFARAILPEQVPGASVGLDWGLGILASLLFFGALLAHELAHSLVSRHFGIPVARIVLFLLGGISQSTREFTGPGAEFLVAIAGPATSALFGVIFLGIGEGLRGPTLLPWRVMLAWLGIMNLAIAAFNLIPGFPLDGGRVLRSALWRLSGSLEKATRQAGWTGQLVGLLLFAWGVYQVLVGNWLGGLWLAFLGLGLRAAAGASITQVQMEGRLARLPVREVMNPRVVAIPGQMSLREATESYLRRYPFPAYPVLRHDPDGEVVEGLLDAEAARRLARRPGDLSVECAMTPLRQADALSPEESVSEAMHRLERLGVAELPVIQDHHLVGVLSEKDVVRWLAWLPEDHSQQ